MNLPDPMVYNFFIMIIDDDIYEDEEYFTLSIIDPPGLENVTTVITIIDNERKIYIYHREVPQHVHIQLYYVLDKKHYHIQRRYKQTKLTKSAIS